jgi:hypothetical protein
LYLVTDVVMTLKLRLRLKAIVTSAVPVKRALTSHEIVSSCSPLHLVATVCIIEYLEMSALPRECA